MTVPRGVPYLKKLEIGQSVNDPQSVSGIFACRCDDFLSDGRTVNWYRLLE